MPTRLTILGATGSIGQSALKVVRQYPDAFEVVGLSAHSNATVLTRLAEEFRPAYLALADTEAMSESAFAGSSARVLTGPDALEELAAIDVDVVLCGVVGAVGLRAILRAIEAGNRIALANKEPMVMAGRLITEAARRRGVVILPVDSEHNALFQCLEGRDPAEVHRVYLTASGGPFYGQPPEALRHVTPDQAIQHPTWDMGAKISVDSATLMNKGLEVIEAMWLFGLSVDQIEILIHPQSIVHGLVEFTDGHILAHLGVTDMTLPIQFALSWPKRVKSPMARLDLTAMKALTFAGPDFSEFPCLGLALDAAQQGGTAPAVLNAANEAAVDAFRRGRIPFLGVAKVIDAVMKASTFSDEYTLESILEVDRQSRRLAESVMPTSGVRSL